MDSFKFFSGSANQNLAQEVASELKVELTPALLKRFSDGNLYVKLAQVEKNQPYVIMQSLGLMRTNTHFMELLFMLDALKREGSTNNLVVLPYFSYAKADRLESPGTSLRSQVCAQCLQTVGAKKVIALDLHSPVITTYFDIPVVNLSPVDFFYNHLRTLNLTNTIIVSPDQGYHAQATDYAQKLACPVSCGHKTRADDQEHVAEITIEGDFAGKTAIIVDDFTTSGNTLLYLSELLANRGASRIIVAVTHCLTDDAALTRLLNSPITQLITTNSLANPALNNSHHKLTRLNLAPLLAEAITANLS